ncbi:MAG: S41 family peptidase [Balneolaceae bacterium]|nr:S41 family peptidase [Balneolaceae bacterium]MDR9407430.1 S41 family peptidase [Balneolaceae bacterium]
MLFTNRRNFQIIITFVLTVFSTAVLAFQNEPHFTHHPSLTPDADTIIFSYETDLWKVPADGGTATRLTAMDGIETRPSVSPDGRWIAFSSNQYGNYDLYVMPIDGGEVTQLTFHQSTDEVEGWSWDSETIYFTSNRENRFSSWKISIEGGTPARIFDHYHNTDHNLAIHPNGSYYFNTSWESKNQDHRKRYRGAFAPQIEVFDPSNEQYDLLTEYDGKDMWPTIDENGTVYFVSDELNGEYNLYRFNMGVKEALTEFSSSIKFPNVSANGEKVVFERDYQVWIYDVEYDESNKVPISVYGNSTLTKEQDFRVSGNITSFDVSPDKKKLAFSSRGELFISDAEGKFIRRLPTSVNGRVLEVLWMSDNKTILFNQTKDGYQNLYTISADGSRGENQLTDEMQNNRSISLNSDRTQAVYLSGRGEVRLMDLDSYESETVVEDEIWDIFSSDPQFSPDDNYIVYTAFRNFEQNVYIYDIENESTISITDTFVSETSPVWSPDGKYIYFQTNRTQPSYPYGQQNPDIYRIALDLIEPDFRSEQVDKLFEETEEDEADSNNENGEESEEESIEIIIREEGLNDRWEQVGTQFGSQTSPQVFKKDEKTFLLFRSNHDEGEISWWKTVFEPFESPKTEKIDGTQMGSSGILNVDDSYWLLLNGDIHTMNIESGSVEKVEINHTFQRNLRDEFNQMFDEMWANLEENFYSSDFHGENWESIRQYYQRFLPEVRTRSNLRELLNDMVGELNSSHLGFYSTGDEEDVYYGSSTLATGILFEDENPYSVERIVDQSPAWQTDGEIQPGDELIGVNGLEVDPSQNRESYFANPSMDEELVLTFLRGSDEFEVKLKPTSYASVRSDIYEEWIDQRQQIVDEQSDERIAYVHMRNMGGGELQDFKEEMVSEGEQRDALILDLRYNTGGNVHDEVLRFLSQRPYLQWGYREGELTTQSNFTPAAKPIVLLVNEQSLSDAELTTQGFKELGLGTIIGTETYRWIIFTSGKGLVDGSFYRLPSWGVYTFEGENLEKTGVSPDIYVKNTFKDRLAGEDPQLQRALEHIIQELNE